MAHRTIPQRELRNSIAAVLRDVEAGGTFTITVRGRPVAQLGPVAPRPSREVEAGALDAIYAIPIDSEQFAAELDEAEAPIGDPLSGG